MVCKLELVNAVGRGVKVRFLKKKIYWKVDLFAARNAESANILIVDIRAADLS